MGTQPWDLMPVRTSSLCPRCRQLRGQRPCTQLAGVPLALGSVRPSPPRFAGTWLVVPSQDGCCLWGLTPDPSRAAGPVSSVSGGDTSSLLTSSLSRATLSQSHVATESEVRWAISLAVSRQVFLTLAKSPLALPHFENEPTGTSTSMSQNVPGVGGGAAKEARGQVGGSPHPPPAPSPDSPPVSQQPPCRVTRGRELSDT